MNALQPRLLAALEQLAAKRGYRPPSLVVAAATRSHLHLVEPPPKPRPAQPARCWWIRKQDLDV